MDGNLRSGNQEIEGDQGSDEAIQVGASSEKSQVTGFDDNSRGSAEQGEDETACGHCIISSGKTKTSTESSKIDPVPA